MNWKKSRSVLPFSAILLMFFGISIFGQEERPRVIITDATNRLTYSELTPNSKPLQSPPKATNSISRPALTNQLMVVGTNKQYTPLVKKTGSSTPTNPIPSDPMRRPLAASPVIAAFNQRLSQAMDSKLGISYVYGSTGPYTYDCSGLVWSVFQEAGLNFERASARNYWQEFEPVYGDDRFKFGTLVFFNGLGHVGIVVSDKGFYHASSSKGVTYSSFEGYWENRIVGFRRIPDSMMPYANRPAF